MNHQGAPNKAMEPTQSTRGSSLSRYAYSLTELANVGRITVYENDVVLEMQNGATNARRGGILGCVESVLPRDERDERVSRKAEHSFGRSVD
jgi:hypothetical protein